MCGICYTKYKKIPFRKQKTAEKRKEERECLGSFFEYHIKRVRKCENCGVEIRKPTATNIAHIVPKSKFKSVMCLIMNAMYLCLKCHNEYDNSWSRAKDMDIWEIAKKRLNGFKVLIKEKSSILKHFE